MNTHEQNEDVQTETDETFADLWAGLEPVQRTFVLKRLEGHTVTSAAAEVGVGRTTTYAKSWANVERCVELAQTQALEGALSVLQRALLEAASVKVAGLRSAEERIRQGVATELIERFAGKAKTEIDLNHGGSVGHQVQVYLPENGRDLT